MKMLYDIISGSWALEDPTGRAVHPEGKNSKDVQAELKQIGLAD
jgi:hypothetical protein